MAKHGPERGNLRISPMLRMPVFEKQYPQDRLSRTRSTASAALMKHAEASEVSIGIVAAVRIRTIVQVWAELYYAQRPSDAREGVTATRVAGLSYWCQQ